MLLNFSSVQRRGKGEGGRLRGRTGHGVARLKEWLFVVGGLDQQGDWVNEVQRIHCQSGRIDSLLLDGGVCLDGACLFSLKETLYLWGGSSLTQYSNQLTQFDCSRFSGVKQTGEVPQPRANHLATTFANKYLIIFGGNNASQFFSDWHLFNIATLEWRRLTPSLPLSFSSGGKMVWLGGRGLLLLNEVYDQTLKTYASNLLFQFYVSDFNAGTLCLTALTLPALPNSDSLLFTHLAPLSNDSFLVFGGYRRRNLKDSHGLCFSVDLQSGTVSKVSLPSDHLLGFESIFYKDTLFLIGGDSTKQTHYSGLAMHTFKPAHLQFKRHVCEMCRLYFDEEWVGSTREIYTIGTVKEDHDYSYNLKMDNRVLEKFALYIRDEFYAFTLILTCLDLLAVQEVEVNFPKIKPASDHIIDEHEQFQFLKLSCSVAPALIGAILNQLIVETQFQTKDAMLDESVNLGEVLLRLKLGTFRLGASTLLTFRLSASKICVVFYSSSQLECLHTSFSTMPCYLYTYDSLSKVCSSSINRSIVHENVHHVFRQHEDYEDVGDANFSLISFCGDSLEAEIALQEHSTQPETGESSIIGPLKELKRSVPLIQMAFLPSHKLSQVFIEQAALTFIDLYDLLQGDCSSKVLQEINLASCRSAGNKEVFSVVKLYNYPEEYWFKRVLVYHGGRLISHFKQPQGRVCGVIQLQTEVGLDVGGTNLARHEDRLVVESLLQEVRSRKRGCPL